MVDYCVNALCSIKIFYVGSDVMVSCSRSTTGLSSLFNSNRHLEYWLYFCWDDHETSLISRRFGDWSVVSYFSVCSEFKLNWVVDLVIFSVLYRTLGTPTEETWPGVSQLPDYKPTFPNWKSNNLASSVKNLSKVGLDILQVCLLNTWMSIPMTCCCLICRVTVFTSSNRKLYTSVLI